MCLEIVNNLYIVSLSTHHVHTIIQSLNRRNNGDNYNHDRVGNNIMYIIWGRGMDLNRQRTISIIVDGG